jgi:hypothetical protein
MLPSLLQGKMSAGLCLLAGVERHWREGGSASRLWSLASAAAFIRSPPLPRPTTRCRALVYGRNGILERSRGCSVLLPFSPSYYCLNSGRLGARGAAAAAAGQSGRHVLPPQLWISTITLFKLIENLKLSNLRYKERSPAMFCCRQMR